MNESSCMQGRIGKESVCLITLEAESWGICLLTFGVDIVLFR
jgi:hypothetical protein